MTATLSPRHQQEAVRWVEEPIYWARKFGGEPFDPWSGQEQFWLEYGKLLSAKLKRYKQLPMTDDEKRYARKMGISIMAGQGLGKGATLSLAALHYLFALQGASPKVVCTAPAGPQLHSSLWPEFGAWLARTQLLGEMFEKNAHRIFVADDPQRGNVSRIEPRTVQPNAAPEDQKVVLAGVHAKGVMYLVDEASGVPEAVFEPLEGGLTDPLSMIILIFNPTRRTGFAIDSHQKNRDMWIPLQWSGEDLAKEKQANPGRFRWFNEEVQVALANKYGKESDFYRVRVLGLPPVQSSDTLISFDSVMSATERVIDILPTDPLVIPVDVGGPDRGGDPSIVMPMRGPQLLTIHDYTEKSPTTLAQVVAGHVREHLAELTSDVQFAIGVDVIGIGRGVYSHLNEIERLSHLYQIDVSEKALDERRFHRLRDQLYWELREGFMELREISLRMLDKGLPVLDDELIGELSSIRWAEVDGKIKIQGKGSSSGIPNVPPLAKSPNKADCLAMGWYLYKHCCSRMPPGVRRQRRARQSRAVSWKAL